MVQTTVGRQYLPPRLCVYIAMVVSTLVLCSCVANPQSVSKQPLISVPAYDKERVLSLNVGEITEGFNPHLRAQLSQSSLVVAALTLPSPFERIVHSDGSHSWKQRTDTFSGIRSEINPKTHRQVITYSINHNAQWSDNTPITGDDFIYLWKQMVKNPATVGGYAYSLIDNIKANDEGFTVKVTLKAPLEHWQHLFQHLLPSHALRESPHGFTNGLFHSSPLSGSYYTLYKAEKNPERLLLVRNDRYWGHKPAVDYIDITTVGQQARIYSQTMSLPLYMAMVDSDDSLTRILDAIPGISLHSLPTEQAVSVYVNPRRIPDVTMRKYLLQSVDRTHLTHSYFLNKHFVEYEQTYGGMFASTRSGIFSGNDNVLRDYLLRRGYTMKSLSAQQPFHQDDVSRPPAVTSYDIEYMKGKQVFFDQYNHPVFFVIGVVQGDIKANVLAGNLAAQISSMGFIPKVRTVAANKFYGKPSQYFDAALGYDIVGYGAENDYFTPLNMGFYAGHDERNYISYRQHCMTQIEQILRQPSEAKNLSGWKKFFTEQWLWLPLGQRIQLTVISPNIHIPVSSRMTASGILNNITEWTYTFHNEGSISRKPSK